MRTVMCGLSVAIFITHRRQIDIAYSELKRNQTRCEPARPRGVNVFSNITAYRAQKSGLSWLLQMRNDEGTAV